MLGVCVRVCLWGEGVEGEGVENKKTMCMCAVLPELSLLCCLSKVLEQRRSSSRLPACMPACLPAQKPPRACQLSQVNLLYTITLYQEPHTHTHTHTKRHGPALKGAQCVRLGLESVKL